MTEPDIKLLSVDKVRFLSAVDLGIAFEEEESPVASSVSFTLFKNLTKQKIYFGAPGAGKSRQVQIDTNGMTVFRTTFHPDTDYAGFVGAYKPALISDAKGNNTITYASYRRYSQKHTYTHGMISTHRFA